MNRHCLFAVTSFVGLASAQLSVLSCTEAVSIFEHSTDFTQQLVNLYQEAIGAHADAVRTAGNRILRGKDRKSFNSRVQALLDSWCTLLCKVPNQNFDENDAGVARRTFRDILGELSFAAKDKAGSLYGLNLFTFKELSDRIKRVFCNGDGVRPIG